MITKQQVERMGLFQQHMNNVWSVKVPYINVSVVVEFSPLSNSPTISIQAEWGHVTRENIKTPAQLYAFTVQLLGLDDEITGEKLTAAGFAKSEGYETLFSIGGSINCIEVYTSDGEPCAYVVEDDNAVGFHNITTMSALLNLCEAFGVGFVSEENSDSE